MIGNHCVKNYSNTQDIIALSSGEAEFYGIVKAGSHGLGVVGIFRDLGLELELQINTDSVAAKSICSRRGTGKVRHLDVRELWIQERVSRGDLSIRKVHGPDNLADILTKHVPRSVPDEYLHNTREFGGVGDTGAWLECCAYRRAHRTVQEPRIS